MLYLKRGLWMQKFEKIVKTYNLIAKKYDLKRSNPEQNSWNEFLEIPLITKFLKNKVSDKDVLDLGCGTGHLTQKIYEWGGKVKGIDLSDKMIAIAKKSLNYLNFYVGNAIKLPFYKNEFDIVTSSLVLHYVQDLKQVFSEVSRVLKSNGKFVFTMHHPMAEVMTFAESESGDCPLVTENTQKISPITLSPYFHNKSYIWEMCGEKIESYHHTFEEITQSFKDFFVLTDLLEAKPSQKDAKNFKDFAKTNDYPTFLGIELQKR